MNFEFLFVSVVLPLIVCAMGWGAVFLNRWHNKREDARNRSGERHQPLGPEDAALVSNACQRALKLPHLWAFNFPYLMGGAVSGDQPVE
jgi:hypothetical protein